MSGKFARVIAVASLATLSLGDAHADAELFTGSRGAMVNAGAGYRAVSGHMAVKTGYRVMVLQKSEAILRFSDGCTLPVSAGRVVTIPQNSPCGVKAGQTATSNAVPVIMTGTGLLFAVAIVANGLQNTRKSFVSP